MCCTLLQCQLRNWISARKLFRNVMVWLLKDLWNIVLEYVEIIPVMSSSGFIALVKREDGIAKREILIEKEKFLHRLTAARWIYDYHYYDHSCSFEGTIQTFSGVWQKWKWSHAGEMLVSLLHEAELVDTMRDQKHSWFWETSSVVFLHSKHRTRKKRKRRKNKRQKRHQMHDLNCNLQFRGYSLFLL